MKITDKFSNGVPKISVVWILSMFMLQVATIITMYLVHTHNMLFGHLSPLEKLEASNTWAFRLAATVMFEGIITAIVACWISIKSRKWNS